MNKAKKYIPLFTVLILLVLSCEETIEFKGERVDPKVVIYSLFNPDSIIKVSVSRSYAVFDIDYQPAQITDADVKIYGDGSLIETLTYIPPPSVPDGYPPVPVSEYTSNDLKPEPGVVYRIEVAVPGVGYASGEVSLPVHVPIERIDTITKLRQPSGADYYFDDYYNKYLEVRVVFSDPPDQSNYYRISVMSTRGYYYGSTDEPFDPDEPIYVYRSDYSYSSYDDPVVNPSQDSDMFGMSNENNYQIFSDELISGKQYGLVLKFNVFHIDTAHYEFGHYDIYLQSVSKDLYLYLRSSLAHVQTDDMPFSEPVIVYTNVENGLGVIGAVLTSEKSLKIGSYPVDGVLYDYEPVYW